MYEETAHMEFTCIRGVVFWDILSDRSAVHTVLTASSLGLHGRRGDTQTDRPTALP